MVDFFSRLFGVAGIAVPGALLGLILTLSLIFNAQAAPDANKTIRLDVAPNRPYADTLRLGQLRGSVCNAAREPLEFANILLLQVADSSLIKTGLSDEKGRFSFADVRPGTYRLRVQALGYHDGRSAPLTVAAGVASPLLPPLLLLPAAQQLGDVLVTARKPLVERKIDRLVLNVDQLPAVAGGTAYDVIKSAPGVTVTATDNIVLAGKSGVLVLIDDRPVRLSQEALMNMLRTMPAENIQQLEVITTPPARYDAQGAAGILNIRTRQRREPGWNADLTLRGGQGQYGRYGGGAVLNSKRKAVELNASYFLGRTRSFEDIAQYARQRDPQRPPTELRTANRAVSTTRYHDAKAQLDLQTGPRSNGGIVASFYAVDNPNTAGGTTQSFAAGQLSDTLIQTSSRAADASHNYSIDGYYTTKPDTLGTVISVDANYARYHSNRQQELANQCVSQRSSAAVGPLQPLRTQLDGATYIQSLKADLTLPLPSFKLETGAKFSRVETQNDFLFERRQADEWRNDALRTNQFGYTETVYAAYASSSRDWAKIALQVGLRGEYTRTLGVSGTTKTSNANNYFRLFPTVYFQYKASENYQLNLSYSRRIERPDFFSLNPFLSYQSEYFSNQGNPFLQPAFTDAFEWANVFKNALNVSPFFNYTSQFSSEYPLQNPATQETTYTFGNLGYSYNYGVTVLAPFTINTWWKVDNNATMYVDAFRSTYAAQPQNRRLFVYNLSLSNAFTIAPHVTAQLAGYYNSPSIQGFFKSVSYYGFNGGITAKLFHEKAVIGLSLADVFYTERGAADVQYVAQDFGFYRRNDTRLLRLAFTYKLGNTGLVAKGQRTGAAQEERARAR